MDEHGSHLQPPSAEKIREIRDRNRLTCTVCTIFTLVAFGLAAVYEFRYDATGKAVAIGLVGLVTLVLAIGTGMILRGVNRGFDKSGRIKR
jgi:hypothetical protein